MASNIRICPNCGAGVVGNTPTCPRCDYPLEAQTSPAIEPAAASISESPPIIEESPSPDNPEVEPSPAVPTFPAPDWEEDTPPAAPVHLAETVTADTSEHRLPAAAPANFENARTAEVDARMIGASAISDTQPAPPPSAPSIPPAVPADIVPAAPYTPPPLREGTRSVAPYSYPSNYYLEQRVIAYRQGGYEMVHYSPYQVTMSYGKPLGLFWWLMAMLSGVGLIWYFIILLASGFSRDRVYLIVERDGTLYEDGDGAAHIRRKRSRVGRRWGFLGVVIFFVALIWFIGMNAVAVWGIQNYQAELEAAYPTVQLFQSDGDSVAESVDPDAIATAESIVLGFSILFALSLICLLTGLTLTIVGYLHGEAYAVKVLPLPNHV